MSNHLHLVELVRKLMNAEGTEDELDDMLAELEQKLPYAEISNLIFWDDRDLTPEQIVEEALTARPIILPPQPDFAAVSGEQKLQALRDLIELTDNHLTQQVLDIGMDSHEEDLVRIEAWRALGMAGSSALLGDILYAAGQLVRNSDEDEDVQNYALQTLALLPVTETEIKLAQEVLEGDAYILVKGAAFAILVAHQHVSGATSVLESLQSDPDFGASAKRVLHSKQGSDNQ